MSRLEVKCIVKTLPGNHPSHITHIGDQTASPPWKKTREQAISEIESRINSFFVKDPRNGQVGEVRVVRLPGFPPHLRTTPDNDLNDNLLSLPSCR